MNILANSFERQFAIIYREKYSTKDIDENFASDGIYYPDNI